MPRGIDELKDALNEQAGSSEGSRELCDLLGLDVSGTAAARRQWLSALADGPPTHLAYSRAFFEGLYSAIRLCAPHVSSPDRSRFETADRAQVCHFPSSSTRETVVAKPLVARFKWVREYDCKSIDD